MVLAVVIVFGNILPMYDTAGHAMRDAWFQVASIVSTTGFATTDFALWPVLPQLPTVPLLPVLRSKSSAAALPVSLRCSACPPTLLPCS